MVDGMWKIHTKKQCGNFSSSFFQLLLIVCVLTLAFTHVHMFMLAHVYFGLLMYKFDSLGRNR